MMNGCEMRAANKATHSNDEGKMFTEHQNTNAKRKKQQNKSEKRTTVRIRCCSKTGKFVVRIFDIFVNAPSSRALFPLVLYVCINAYGFRAIPYCMHSAACLLLLLLLVLPLLPHVFHSSFDTNHMRTSNQNTCTQLLDRSSTGFVLE